MKLIRLYPRDPARGCFITTYVDAISGLKFLGTKGWYKVSDETAEILSEVRQKDYDLRSSKAFMIAANESEAEEMEASLQPTKFVNEKSNGTISTPLVVNDSNIRPGTRKRTKKA